MSDQNTIVLKFGGSVLASEESLAQAVHEIYRWRREGWRVVAVVSALSGRTDELIERCARRFERSSPHAMAAVVAGGELESAALLGVLLDRAGIPASVLSPSALRLIAEGNALDASPIAVDSAAIRETLDVDGVAVVPGFIGIDRRGRTVLLGRGGSDLTALFIASALGGARCRLVKDVPALFERDPSLPGPPPRRYEIASWQDAIGTDGTIVQHKAVRFAWSLGLRFELASLNSDAPSVIGGERSVLSAPVVKPSPLRVAVLGLGSVGRGVYEHLLRLPGEFVVTGVSARHAGKHPDIPASLFVPDAVALAGQNADVVVEAIGGIEPAMKAAVATLRRGAHFVTANKALIAAHGDELKALARASGGSLRYSAAVGGGVPVLEHARRVERGRIVAIEAVLNGTSNYVLDSCASGSSLADAVKSAQALGFAEADPSRDLDGRDAADKLAVLAADLGAVVGEARRETISQEVIDAGPKGEAGAQTVVRQVARLELGARPAASVSVRRLERSHPLALLREEQNGVIIECAGGERSVLIGRGAGRWPTAESVLADVLDVRRVEKKGAER